MYFCRARNLQCADCNKAVCTKCGVECSTLAPTVNSSGPGSGSGTGTNKVTIVDKKNERFKLFLGLYYKFTDIIIINVATVLPLPFDLSHIVENADFC